MKRVVTCLCVVSIVLTIGCRTRKLQNDQDQMRFAIMDMYTNQIMDNLVRAYKGYPFVQMQYKNINGTINQSGDGSINGSIPEGGRMNLGLGLGGTQRSQLTVTANPVIDNDAVYLAYVEFASDPEKFLCTPEPPPHGAAHICVCRDDGNYYWVPVDKSRDFLKLSLATTVMSKGGAIKIPESYTTTVVELMDLEDPKADKVLHIDDWVEIADYKKSKGMPDFMAPNFAVKVQFGDYIPAAEGTMEAKVNDKAYTFRLNRIVPTENPERGAAVEGQRTNFFKLSWSYGEDQEQGQIPVAPADLRNALVGQSVQVTIPQFRPGFGTTGEVLDAILNEMTLFRLNQVVPSR